MKRIHEWMIGCYSGGDIQVRVGGTQYPNAPYEIWMGGKATALEDKQVAKLIEALQEARTK